MRTNITLFERRRSEKRASLCPSNQIFIYLKQLLENNAKQTDNFFWTLHAPLYLRLPHEETIEVWKEETKSIIDTESQRKTGRKFTLNLSVKNFCLLLRAVFNID